MQDNQREIDMKAIKNDKDLLRELFLTLHSRIEQLHKENQCLNGIHIPFRLDDFYIKDIMNQDERLFVMRQNLIDMALLAIATYSDCEEYFSEQWFASRKKILEDPAYFQEFAKYLPQEDVAYYHIILYQNTIYYYSQYQKSDYYQSLIHNKDNDSLASDGNSNHKGKAYVYSNPYGQLFTQEEPTVEKAGFIKILVLPGVMITTVILFALLWMLKCF